MIKCHPDNFLAVTFLIDCFITLSQLGVNVNRSAEVSASVLLMNYECKRDRERERKEIDGGERAREEGGERDKRWEAGEGV